MFKYLRPTSRYLNIELQSPSRAFSRVAKRSVSALSTTPVWASINQRRTILNPCISRSYSGSTPPQIDKPTYQLTFTCKACKERSSHHVSKQAYHNGTVLIQCPGCKNRHLIADHLNVFGQGKHTLEEILSKRGEKITKRTVDLGKIGDIQWEGPHSEPELKLPDTSM